jgi:hypothetical protein
MANRVERSWGLPRRKRRAILRNMKRALVFLLSIAFAFPAGVAARGLSREIVAPLTIEGSGVRTIAVVPINFEGQRIKPTTQARLGNMFFNSPDTDKFSESLASYWELSSYGRERIEGKVFPLTQIASMSSCNEKMFDEWASIAQSFWEGRGESLNEYDHLVLVMPFRKCDFGGWAYTPGKLIIVNQPSSYWETARTGSSITLSTIAHELIHSRGFGHSGIVSCEANGKKLSLGGECKETDRYKYDWDPNEIITSGGYWPKRLMNSFQRITLGFISAEEQIRLDASGTYQVALNPIEFTLSGAKALVIRRLGISQFALPTYDNDGITSAGASDICIEWHQPRGWFNDFAPKSPIVRGISMRLCDLYSGGVEYALEEGGSETGFYQAGTRLIDATPGSKAGKADWTDAQLTKGTWTDEFTGITIRVVGFSKTGTDRSQWSINLEVVIP